MLFANCRVECWCLADKLQQQSLQPGAPQPSYATPSSYSIQYRLQEKVDLTVIIRLSLLYQTPILLYKLGTSRSKKLHRLSSFLNQNTITWCQTLILLPHFEKYGHALILDSARQIQEGNSIVIIFKVSFISTFLTETFNPTLNTLPPIFLKGKQPNSSNTLWLVESTKVLEPLWFGWNRTNLQCVIMRWQNLYSTPILHRSQESFITWNCHMLKAGTDDFRGINKTELRAHHIPRHQAIFFVKSFVFIWSCHLMPIWFISEAWSHAVVELLRQKNASAFQMLIMSKSNMKRTTLNRLCMHSFFL